MKLKVLFAGICCLISTAAAIAVDAPTSTDEPAATNPDKKLLQGGVKGAVLLLEDGLKKMGEATNSIQNASLRVMNEVTRKETIGVRGPNYIGNGIVIPALPTPSGTIQMGSLPARAKYLNQFTNQATYYVQLLQNEVDALMLPDERSPEVDRLWGSIRNNMDQVQGHLSNLKQLTVGPRYNNEKIAREALGIYDGAKVINKLRRQLIQQFKQ